MSETIDANMSGKTKLLLFTLFLITAVSLLTVFFTEKKEEIYKPGMQADLDRAVNQARSVYEEKKAKGYDFTDGPCLTNDLSPDWVADLVHDPRVAQDDLEKNQCQAYLEGRAKHFVELDLDGNVVRVK